MITQRCKNPNCDRMFTPDAAHRFAGCCSAECARAMTTHRHHLTMRPSNFMSDQHRERPGVNRRNGTDNKVQS